MEGAYSERNREIVVFGIEEVSILERFSFHFPVSLFLSLFSHSSHCRQALKLGESVPGRQEYEYVRLDEDKVSISFENGQLLYGMGIDFTQNENVFIPREGKWFVFMIYLLFFYFYFYSFPSFLL